MIVLLGISSNFLHQGVLFLLFNVCFVVSLSGIISSWMMWHIHRWRFSYRLFCFPPIICLGCFKKNITLYTLMHYSRSFGFAVSLWEEIWIWENNWHHLHLYVCVCSCLWCLWGPECTTVKWGHISRGSDIALKMRLEEPFFVKVRGSREIR